MRANELTVLHENAPHGASDSGPDLIEQLHRLNEPNHVANRHDAACLDEGR